MSFEASRCSICFEFCCESNAVSLSQCGHEFCSDCLESWLVQQERSMSSGYISTMEWKPTDVLVNIYAALTVIHLVLLLWYHCRTRLYRDAAIPIQKFILATMVIGFLDLFFWISGFGFWNDWEHSEPNVWQTLVYGEMVFAGLHNGIMRCLILMVSMGWGVVRASLGGTLFSIILFGMVYFCLIVEWAYSALHVWWDIADWIFYCLMNLDLLFNGVVFISLKQTNEYLKNVNQTSKLQRHLRLQCIILAAVPVALNDFLNFFIIRNRTLVTEALRQTTFLFVLIAVAILWRPNSNAKDFPMQMEIPAMGEDDENELQVSCVVPSAGEMDDANDPGHPDGLRVDSISSPVSPLDIEMSLLIHDGDRSLRDASESLNADQIVVRVAMQSGFISHFRRVYAGIQRHKDLMLFLAMRYFSNGVSDDKVVVLAALDAFAVSLQVASERLRDDKEVVMAAVNKSGSSLQYASERLRNDKDVVLAALNEFAGPIKYASRRLQKDKNVIMTLLRHNGNILQALPEDIRGDKEYVLAAISSQPVAIKFALNGLNQDPDCLVKAGLWDEDQGYELRERKVVLSTRFSLAAESTPTASEFTVLLKNHPFFRDALSASVYSPNAFNKKTCDPNWTDIDWPCRGTKETCQMVDRSLCEGDPRDECCWRYSYRCHLADARDSGGFMIQVVELSHFDGSGFRNVFGNGQMIEKEMAQQVGTKAFVVYQPGHGMASWLDDDRAWNYRNYNSPDPFCNADIDQLAKNVKNWYDNGCEDMSPCFVRLGRQHSPFEVLTNLTFWLFIFLMNWFWRFSEYLNPVGWMMTVAGIIGIITRLIHSAMQI